jgi:hypothetical protein
MKRILLLLVPAMILLSDPGYSQAEARTEKDTTLLGLPGDNLDLFAVLDLFQKSKTIEDFEKSLNTEKTGINNLDLNLDNKVDFIKVITKQEKNDFTFILQVDISEKEKQDVAVILVSKDDKGKVTIQIVGDPDLYGNNYIIEPKPAAPPVTPNPAYTGNDPVTKTTPPTTTTTVVVESAPVVQYIYSPVYVPYFPPPVPPPYFVAFTVMAVSAYHYNTYHYHGAYYGGRYGNTVVINNNYNNYNNYRNSSNTVSHNKASGNYNRNNASTRPSGGASASTRPSTLPSTGQSKGNNAAARPSTGQSPGNKAAARPSTGMSRGNNAATQPSTGQSLRGSQPTARPASSSSRPSSGNMSSSGSRSNYSSSSPSRSNQSYSGSRGGGGRSSGSYGGGSRGGGGGRGGRR